ncbi:MAG: CoA ester lyase [Clostridia bacterium]|nr:CoA ester lyase [Clostridia bacterium]
MIRTLSFLPGNTPNMLINGETLGADALILDLEDAVSPAEKDTARILVRNYLRTQRIRKTFLIVRINATDTAYWRDDLAIILPEKPDAVLPTKVSGRQMLDTLTAEMSRVEQDAGLERPTPLLPLIETAMGVENAIEIASYSDRIMGLALGGEDLTADLHCKRTKEGQEIFYARTRLVCAARAAGVNVFDTPFTDVDDMEGLEKDAQFAKALGFSGKLVISPRHIDTVNAVFSPTEEEIEYARLILACIRDAKAQGKGVVSLRGKMIDAPIVARARQVVEDARQIFGEEEDTDE